MLQVQLLGKTDVGRQREINEDRYGLVESRNLAVVCDGMGGHAAGEVASQCAVDTISALYLDMELPPGSEAAFDLPVEFSEEGRRLVSAIRIANTRIYEKSDANPTLAGMGTTIVAVVFHDNRMSICHVGDSRAYRFRNGVLKQLTNDHSLVGELVASKQISPEEARDFPNKNVITRALGVRERVKIDLREEGIAPGDIFLLCSDGLTGCLPDTEILGIISAASEDLHKIANDLIDGANNGGGDDNITCALVRVDSARAADESDPGLETITFPEENDLELAAQKIVADFLDNMPEEKEETPVPDEVPSEELTNMTTEERDLSEIFEPKGHSANFLLGLILVLVVACVAVLVFDIAGAREFTWNFLGLN
ncbi:MAG: Stp1/IreP family PP2C-type Ser/Thr phosphatase [candidate division Zixibacteria bacterium]|nr:Stp1/IreP family PP2C-type Ser/Thr phosphatase [candidate division Zixibacteria bacterium]MBU1470389.1 Stp1/IreP family PP2C-type Ser/Thr phosphatase [candidate division Zixibacteria bacterium]MBU2624245.1 Stp1/IreP family PP2C-type Ser/Thr phosphatase [candidate division Zixibacteria bacterium]